jgi:hypothetical protein
MWLTVEPPDQRLSQRDNSAEVRGWNEADRRELDAASEQLRTLPATRWLRDLWSAAVVGSSQGVGGLPEEIVEACSRGEELSERDFAFFIRVTTQKEIATPIAALRTLGLLAEAHPFLLGSIAPHLERGLTHDFAAVRAAAAEALWAAGASQSAPTIRAAAAAETTADIREYMLHAARLLSAG